MRHSTSLSVAALLFLILGFFPDAATSEELSLQTPVLESDFEGALLNTDELFMRIAADAPSFGGLYVREPQEQLVVWLDSLRRSDRDQVARSVREHLLAFDPELTRYDLKFRLARHRFGELEEWKRTLASTIMNSPGVVSLDIDELSNRLVVGIEPTKFTAHSENVVRLATQRGVSSEALSVVAQAPLHAELREERRPVVGGLQIRAGTYCTLGFTAFANDALGLPREGLITNSHCTASRGTVTGTVFYQPEVGDLLDQIAIESVDPPFFTGGACPAGRVCRLSDAAFAPYTPQTLFLRGAIAMLVNQNNTQWNGDTYRKISEKGDPLAGQLISKVGRTTGRTQGTVQQTCATVNVANTNITLLCQYQGSYASSGGDSGSPVYRQVNLPLIRLPWGSGGARLGGIHWGSNGWFSPLSGVVAELGGMWVCSAEINC